MLTKHARRLAVVVLAIALLLLVRAWVSERWHEDATSPATGTTQAKPGADASAVESRNATRTTESTRRASEAQVRLDVRVPADVRAGDVFQARIDLDTTTALHDVTLSVTYKQSLVALRGSSKGDFAQSLGAALELGVDEPSDGIVQLTLGAGSGESPAGRGTMAILEFEAIRTGASEIALQDVTAADASGRLDPSLFVLHDGSVTIR